jgi:hypothetical protein
MKDFLSFRNFISVYSIYRVYIENREGGGRGLKEGVNEGRYLYIIKYSRYSVIFGKES